MTTHYQARWVSRARANEIKRTRAVAQGVLLDTFKGFIIVEPVGSNLGDRDVLSPEEAEFELQEVWYTGPKAKLREARQRLGLEAEEPTAHLAGSGA
jgi:hypothetical protein